MNGAGAPSFAPLITIVVVAIFLALRMRRLSQGRPLRVEWLWVASAVLLVMTVGVVIASPPSALGWALLAAVLAVGAGLGWYRGKMMHITVDPGPAPCTPAPRPPPWCSSSC